MVKAKKTTFRGSLLFSSLSAKPLDYEILKRPSIEPIYNSILKNQFSKDTTILITGETGVGKEALAHDIHNKSNRSNKPLFVVNISVGPETLVESELFGHEKGAFTGADHQRIGVLERANGGTVFLDEIGDISLSIQAKLLRALQSKEFNRIGGNNAIRSDFRLICATNKNLLDEIKERRFREDLYYRINVISIYLPSLRDKRDDIHFVAEIFLRECCDKYQIKQIKYDGVIKEYIEKYHWPGNLREMRNRIERIVTNYNDGNFDMKSIFFMGEERSFTKENKQHSEERNYIIAALEKAGGNKVKAAEIYKCSRKHFYNLIHKHKIPL